MSSRPSPAPEPHSPTPARRRPGDRRGERAAILVEYALLIALIVVVCLGAVANFGAKVPSSSFTSVATAI